MPLDRVDNYKGYSLGNVVFACKKCSFQKGSKTLDEFLSITEKIYLNLGSASKGKQRILEEINNLKDQIDIISSRFVFPREGDPEVMPERKVLERSTLKKVDTFAEQIARTLVDKNFDIDDTLEYLRSNVRGSSGEIYAWDRETFEGYLKGNSESDSFAQRILNDSSLTKNMTDEEKQNFSSRFKMAPTIPGRKGSSFWASLTKRDRSKKNIKPNSLPTTEED